MKNYYNIILFALFLFVDYIAVICAEQSAYWLRNFVLPHNALYVTWIDYWIIFPSVFIFFLFINQLYTRRMPFYKEVELTFFSTWYSVLAIIFGLYTIQTVTSTSRFFICILALLAFIYLVVLRYIVKKFLIKNEFLVIPVLIIGAGKTAEILVNSIANDPGMGYKVIGLLEDNSVKSGLLERFPVLGSFSDAENVIKNYNISRVFIAAPGMDAEKLGLLIFKIQPLVHQLSIIPNISGAPMSNIEVESMFYEKLLILRLKNHLSSSWNIFVKALFDYTLTILGTIFVLPILILLAIIIKIDSPGPIIYNGYRLGKNGKLFRCYKFRSMYANSNEILKRYFENHQEDYNNWIKYHKLANDPRVTPFGAFMRKTSLDELPQFFNVLLGDMSLVGPRPYLPTEKEEMGEFANTILITKPGITGYWQTSGRSNVSFKERVYMDCWYICNWNIWLDIIMLFKTFVVVLKRKGAY